jgi:hypothetical protein
MTNTEKDWSVLAHHFAANFARIYLGGIPSLLNNDAAFLSFICTLTAVEALGGFLSSAAGNGDRFKEFIRRYFPDPFPAQADDLWKLRNDIVHGFSTGPYGLIHHASHLHLKRDKQGRPILNAEDFYAALVTAFNRYFDEVPRDPSLQANIVARASSAKFGILVVGEAEIIL